MREVVFRGKLKADNGEFKKGDWVYGDLVRMKDGDNIKTFIYGFGEVIPDTVGQHIGLKDVKGKRIFEGDILENFIGQRCAVTYESGYYYPLIAFPEFQCWSTSECAVIGNIHDNPELLNNTKEE